MEMLTGSSHASGALVTPDMPKYEEPQQMNPRESLFAVNGGGSAGGAGVGTYAASQYRQSTMSSRYSAVTIDGGSPDPNAGYFMGQPGGNTSPNRQKNLPPLPPGMAQSLSGGVQSPQQQQQQQDMYADFDNIQLRARMYDPNQQKRMSSAGPYPRTSIAVPNEPPTVHRAAIAANPDYFPTASPRYHQASLSQQSQASTAPSLNGQANGHLVDVPNGAPMVSPQPPYLQPIRTLQPRASFDFLTDSRSRMRRSTATNLSPDLGLAPQLSRDREPSLGGGSGGFNRGNVQSMYMNNGAAASTGSFGRFLKISTGENHRAAVQDSVPQTNDKKERRRGIKSIFSKAK